VIGVFIVTTGVEERDLLGLLCIVITLRLEGALITVITALEEEEADAEAAARAKRKVIS
jgi:hypothetical protein